MTTSKLVVDFCLGKRHIPKQNHGNRRGFGRKLQQQRQRVEMVDDLASEAKIIHFSLVFFIFHCSSFFFIVQHFSVLSSFLSFYFIVFSFHLFSACFHVSSFSSFVVPFFFMILQFCSFYSFSLCFFIVFNYVHLS